MAKIVVVDDEPDLLYFVEGYLKTQGHEVLTTLYGREAIRLILESKPDVALIDIRLKDDVDGLQVIKAVREKNPHQKIILVTAYNDKDREALEEGVLCCLRKPCGIKEIDDAISLALDQK